MKVNSRHFLRSSRFAAGRLALLFVLFVLLVGAAQAQEDDRPEVTPVQGPGIPPDGHDNGQGPEIPPVEILKEELGPDGVNIVVQIPVSKDSYISSANPNTNYGAAGTSRIGYQAGGAGATRIVLQFDLSSIPSNVVINEAEFQ